MPQYRPSGLVPSTLTPEPTIDATKPNQFRCQINGSSPTISYSVVILNNTALSETVYADIRSIPPLYPIGYDGLPNELVIDIPSNSGMVNGKQYKWIVRSFWTENESAESYEAVFNTNSTPSVRIAELNGPTITTINTKSYTFNGIATQAEGVAVERFGFLLRNSDTGEELVNTIDSNNIYSSQIILQYDGFFSKLFI